MFQNQAKSLFTTTLLLFSLAQLSARANDGIFPPAPAAAGAINFDGKGFIINGQRTFIASGGMEYARVPRALWRDRLLKMKRAGFNCTETYVFWNFHERTENNWNFTGDHDLNAYLQLVHQLGMYAIVRVGPYVCAEWNSGGWPVWLRFKPGVQVRKDNQPFLDETFKYYDHVVPIVAANQINHGGSVILVQIENEDGDGWGTDHSLYEQKLRDHVLSLGIEVPTFFSGLHHGGDPAGDTPWDDATRVNPWFTTEFWCSWYSDYGDRNYDGWVRGAWKIIAFGGNGYNYYMFHGGTNFDDYNNNEDAASYDYGTVVGQGGDLRSGYYKFKEAALFAQTFASILENSVSSQGSDATISTNSAPKIYGRTGPSGSISFIDNASNQSIQTQVKGGRAALEPANGPVTIAESMMLPVVRNFAITPTIKIDQSVTQILTSVTNGNNTTLIVYGPAGSNGSIELSSPATLSLVSGQGWTAADPSRGNLEFTYPANGFASTIISSGADKLQILAMGEPLAERSWPVTTRNGTYIILGPDYVDTATATAAGNLSFLAVSNSPALGQVSVVDPDLSLKTLPSEEPSAALPSAPALTDWLQSTVNEAAPTFNAATWLSTPQPQYAGADGDTSAYAWYRTSVTVNSAKPYYLMPTTVRDRMIVFVDGKKVAAEKTSLKCAELDLTAGTHKITILTADYGRNKLVGYAGPIDTIDAKGLGGPVVLSDLPTISLTGWRNLTPVANKPDTTTLPAPTDLGWQASNLSADLFNHTSGWAWYQDVVPANLLPATASKLSIHFDCVDDNATVFCNGSVVGTHQGWDTGFDLDLSSAWLPGQSNTITVLDENTAGAGGISGNITISPSDPANVLSGWKLRGGIGDPTLISSWQPIAASPDLALPTFYQAQFVGSQPTGKGAYPIYRVHLGGLSAGFVWLNGHNLGRYPEKIPIDGLYLPECWINKGPNTLTIFDEDGKTPTGVNLYTETAASRYDFPLTN